MSKEKSADEGERAWVSGLRLYSHRTKPDWFTLWFLDDERKLLVEDDQIVWVRSQKAARRLIDRRAPGPVTLADEPPGLCDIPEFFGGLARLQNGRGRPFMTALNAMDDLYLGVRSIQGAGKTRFAAAQSVLVLDRLRDGLVEGRDVPASVEAVGGADIVAQAGFELLGRVLAYSRFDAKT